MNKICAHRWLNGTDVKNATNGRRNLSNLKMLMNYMITELKRKKKYIDRPTEYQVHEMYKAAVGIVLSLSDNKRVY